MPTKRDAYATPGEKLIGLLWLLLFSERKYSLSQLATKFRCSRPSVLRMIERIERSQVVRVETEIVERQRFYWASRPQMSPRLSFTQNELNDLVLCRDLVRHFMPGEMLEEYDLTMLKAAAFTDAGSLPEPGETCEVQFKGRIDYTPFQGVIADLMAAASQKRLCLLAYQSTPTSEVKSHYYGPVKLLAYRESLYTHGWLFREVDDKRPSHEITFAIQRIRQCRPLDRNHAISEAPPVPRGFGVINGEPFRVKLKFYEPVAGYVQERIWSDDQKLTRFANGNVDLEFTANSWDELRSWVLSFGENVKVLAPKELRDDVVEQAQFLIENHQ